MLSPREGATAAFLIRGSSPPSMGPLILAVEINLIWGLISLFLEAGFKALMSVASWIFVLGVGL